MGVGRSYKKESPGVSDPLLLPSVYSLFLVHWLKCYFFTFILYANLNFAISRKCST